MALYGFESEHSFNLVLVLCVCVLSFEKTKKKNETYFSNEDDLLKIYRSETEKYSLYIQVFRNNRREIYLIREN